MNSLVTTLKDSLQDRRWEGAVLLTSVLMLAYLLMRNTGLYPAVFGDEMLYSMYARLNPLREAAIPSYLYFAAYGVTNACDSQFLECVRGLNALLFVAAAPFIYLSARQFVGKPLAWLVMALSLLLPLNSYTTFFMPEAPYFFAFYVLTWVALTRTSLHWAAHALLLGTLLGAMSLIKVHALFLIPALCGYVFLLAWSMHRHGRWLRIGIGAACLSAIAAVGVKFAIGYALADTNGLHLFGSFYGNVATGTSHHGLFRLLEPGFINLRGHLMSIAVLFGLPLAVLAHALLSRALRTEAGTGLIQLYWYSFLMLGAALGMTVLYTASIADIGPREGVRLHVRYYSFTFPLLLMIGAAAFAHVPRAGSRSGAVLIALALGAASLLAIIKIPTYFLGDIDGPDIAMLDLTAWPGRALVALNLLILGLWVARSRAAGALFMFAYVPALVGFAYLSTAALQARLVHPNPFDTAGMYVRQSIPADQRGQITVAGTGLSDLMRTKFHIDAAGVTLLEMAKNAPYDLSHLPARNKWLLVVGPHALPPELKPSVANAQFALVPIVANHARIGAAVLHQADLPALFTRIDGLADVEPWGRWSTGSQVALHFAQALPRRLTVILNAQAYGPNAGMEFTARVGQAEQRFRIPSTPIDVFLRFDTDGAQRTLLIDVPQPVAPQSLGPSTDVRTLGIGLINVEIGRAAAPN